MKEALIFIEPKTRNKIVEKPQMTEFNKIKNWVHQSENEIANKLQVISLFSGSGGLDLGFLATGKFEIIFANDFNKAACETYANNIGKHIICEDISQLSNFPKADIIIGGPPCQGFSTANPARSFDDPRNHLFKEYSRIIRDVKPKLFLMENVSGMVTMEKGKVFKLIKKELSSCGYILYDRLLNAKDYGVPQSRRRMIIIGVRKDIDAKFNFPLPSHNENNYVTVGETIINIPISKNNPNHVIGKLTELNLKRIMQIPEGGSMKDCQEKLQNNSDLNRSMRRLHRKKISYTIVHNNCDHYYHPSEHRRITIREMARIQGYPDDFIFTGSKSEQSRQVGNSVPVGLGKAIAKSVYTFLNDIV
jgi:DNA (cytosine-5)-methyltransferase 1